MNKIIVDQTSDKLRINIRAAAAVYVNPFSTARLVSPRVVISDLENTFFLVFQIYIPV